MTARQDQGQTVPMADENPLLGKPALLSVEEQRSHGDKEIIDPAGVSRNDVPLFRNHNYELPDNLLGYARNVREADGRLVVDVDPLPGKEDEIKRLLDIATFGIGGMTGEYIQKPDGSIEVSKFNLIEVSFVARPAEEKPK